MPNTLNTNPNTNSGWQYTIEITAPGTRSEGQWGHLSYNGWELPSVFELIIINDKAYKYYIRKVLWGFGGYKLEEALAFSKAHTDTEITAAELDLGWYLAKTHQQKQGTPPDWVWVKRDNKQAFVDPEKIKSFIKEHNFKTLLPGEVIRLDLENHNQFKKNK